MHNRRQFLKTAGLMSVASVPLLNACDKQPPKPDIHPYKPKNANGLSALTYNFYDTHQSGIATPVQRHIYFLVANLHSTKIDDVKQLFKDWTAFSAKLMNGDNIKPYDKNPHLPPTDTGEADSLGAYGLTLTFGVSPSFLKKLNLNDKAPPEFSDLPHFPRDQIRDELSGGDLCIQACADDPQVAFHAVRQLVRQGRAVITPKWSQSGYNSFDDGNDTPRNLFGFKDGTANADTLKDTDKWLWAKGDGKTAWFDGGTYLVVRLIQMHLETWDRTSLAGQEDTFGRHRDTGASIGKAGEFDAFDVNEKNNKGELVIADTTHMGLAKRTGLQMLRRSFSYSSGIDVKTGQFDAGLLFISFQKSPMQFTAIQSAFGKVDKMSEYTTHIGSGLFACFGGVGQGEYLGQKLFES